MRREAGLTLMELLVAIAVLGVLLSIGVPAFGNFAVDSRLASATNRFVSAIHLARSEAVRRNARVTLCPSGDGVSCATGGEWAQGWIVFADLDSTGERDSGEPILAVGQGIGGGVQITGNTPVRHYISYIGLGATRRANGALQMGTVTLCAGTEGRQVIISRTGRPRVQHGGCNP